MTTTGALIWRVPPIIQDAGRLMMMEDDDVSDEVAAVLRDDGITVLTPSMPRSGLSRPTLAACG